MGGRRVLSLAWLESGVADEWGYPFLAEREVPAHLAVLARRAARLCPTLAPRLEAANAERKSPTGGPEDSARGRRASNGQQAGPR